MKILLIEFPWQLNAVINQKEKYEENKNVIVSLNPECSYILKSNKIKYFETYQFCKHNELWEKYDEITNNTLKIAKILDEVLFEIDIRFKKLNWKLFNDYHYFLKGPCDQMLYYSTLIYKLIEEYNPEEIIVADTGRILINNNFLISSEISILKYLLKGIEDEKKGIKIKYVTQNKKNKYINLLFENVKKFSFPKVQDFLKREIKNIINKINFYIFSNNKKIKYLSINSIEILKYKKIYSEDSKYYLNYNFYNYNFNKFRNDKKFYEKLKNSLNKKEEFYKIAKYKNISFIPILNEILIKLTKNLDFVLKEYKNAEKIINKINPKCVIFNSMNPSNLGTVVFRKNCDDKNIPYAVWQHGGYGLTYSISSFDVTDFRFCKNHITHGEHLKDMVKNDQCILKKLEFNKEQKIFPVGSPRFDFENKNKKIQKKIGPDAKKTILFISGGVVDRNLFYFGKNRQKSETSLWEFHYDILNLLKNYQNKYNIIFKDYANGHKNLWTKVIKDINADKISFFSNEYKTNDLLRISDLNILPWASTTFFEALYFDADIFLLEEDLSEKFFEKNFNEEIFYFKKNENFFTELKKYLDKGDFNICSKKNSKNYFLKFDHLNKRNNLLNDTISKIH